ncbi:hypothetical protein PAHAL_1G345000 [Panicum hallii]|uniref:Uncharacterized protein n=1 Tax=Panicum hallii TaxID=206008 RepID=A0A2T8KX67_9POAL|nr:hypothetical protein PAHAL_1G345000 [Panicum hallii]
MAVSKKNKACLPACRRDGSSRPHTPIRKQSSVTKAGQRGRTRHQDPTRQDPNCAPRQRFFVLPAWTRAEEDDELRRRKTRRSLLDGTGEG